MTKETINKTAIINNKYKPVSIKKSINLNIHVRGLLFFKTTPYMWVCIYTQPLLRSLKMDIKISLSDNKDSYEFKKDIPDGISVFIPPFTIYKFSEYIEPITIIISIVRDISIGLLVTWLYDKFKNCSSEKITIDKKEIILDKGEITRIIEEKITKE